MDFLISDAMAQAAQGAPGEQNLLMSFLPLILIFVFFYFLLIRPQQKRAKEHRQMVNDLTAGDEVVTSGGVLGKITQVEDSFIHVEVAEGTVIRVQRQAVATVMPKGTVDGQSK